MSPNYSGTETVSVQVKKGNITLTLLLLNNEFGHFHFVALQMKVKQCTKMYNGRADLLFFK